MRRYHVEGTSRTSSLGIKYARKRQKGALRDTSFGLLGHTAISVAIIGPPILLPELEDRGGDRRSGTEGVLLRGMSLVPR
jgi:hypothetical protein